MSDQHIQGNYWYGKYGPFQVIYDRSNEYINASTLCSDHGKDINEWLCLDDTQEIIAQFIADTPELQNKDIMMDVEGDTVIAGKYLHRYVIPVLATWIDKFFMVKAFQIIGSIMTEENKTEEIKDMEAELKYGKKLKRIENL